jgi:hypothetical protein
MSLKSLKKKGPAAAAANVPALKKKAPLKVPAKPASPAPPPVDDIFSSFNMSAQPTFQAGAVPSGKAGGEEEAGGGGGGWGEDDDLDDLLDLES